MRRSSRRPYCRDTGALILGIWHGGARCVMQSQRVARSFLKSMTLGLDSVQYMPQRPKMCASGNLSVEYCRSTTLIVDTIMTVYFGTSTLICTLVSTVERLPYQWVYHMTKSCRVLIRQGMQLVCKIRFCWEIATSEWGGRRENRFMRRMAIVVFITCWLEAY